MPLFHVVFVYSHRLVLGRIVLAILLVVQHIAFVTTMPVLKYIFVGPCDELSSRNLASNAIGVENDPSAL